MPAGMSHIDVRRLGLIYSFLLDEYEGADCWLVISFLLGEENKRLTHNNNPLSSRTFVFLHGRAAKCVTPHC